MFILHPLTGIAFGQKSSNFSLHIIPPKPAFAIYVHIGTSGMHGIPGMMSVDHNRFRHVLYCRSA